MSNSLDPLVQTVCQGYQQTTLVGTELIQGKKKDKSPNICFLYFQVFLLGVVWTGCDWSDEWTGSTSCCPVSVWTSRRGKITEPVKNAWFG